MSQRGTAIKTIPFVYQPANEIDNECARPTGPVTVTSRLSFMISSLFEKANKAKYTFAIVVLLFAAVIVLTLFSSSSRFVIVDTDPGGDDALAMYLTMLKVGINGITAVQGNTGIENVIQNILKTLDKSNFKVPVYKGEGIGWSGFVPSDDYFGHDGFGDFVYDGSLDESLVQNQSAADFMIESVKHNPEKVTLIAIGPLTNLATARRKYSSFLKKLKNLVILGGTISPEAIIEFNFMQDPKAAKYVMDNIEEVNDVTMIPFETWASPNNSFSLEYRKMLGESGNDFVQFLNKAENISLINSTIWKIPDPLTTAVVINPKCLKMVSKMRAHVDESGRTKLEVGGNIKVVLQFDMDIIKNLLESSLIENQP